MQEIIVLETGFLDRKIEAEGGTRPYVVYVPDDYSPDRAWPLIVFLYGAGERGSDGLRQIAIGLGTAVMVDRAQWPFVILFPQCPVGVHWISQEEALLEMMRQTQDAYNMDPEKFYLTGLSMGGFGTWAFGAKHTELFAAFAPICGGGDPSMVSGFKDKPIWAFHGDGDTVVPPERTVAMVEAVRAAGADVRLTLLPGVGHNSWDTAYREHGLAKWFLQHTLSGADGGTS